MNVKNVAAGFLRDCEFRGRRRIVLIWSDRDGAFGIDPVGESERVADGVVGLGENLGLGLNEIGSDAHADAGLHQPGHGHLRSGRIDARHAGEVRHICHVRQVRKVRHVLLHLRVGSHLLLPLLHSVLRGLLGFGELLFALVRFGLFLNVDVSSTSGN